MDIPGSSLVRFSELHITDVDEAEDYVRRAYGGSGSCACDDSGRLDFRVRTATCPGFRIDRIGNTGRLQLSAQEIHGLAVFQILYGRCHYTVGGAPLEFGTGSIGLCDQRQAQSALFDDLRAVVVVIDRELAVRVAAEVAEVTLVPTDLSFAHPRSAQQARYWASVVRYVSNEVVGNAAAATNALCMHEAARNLVIALLATFPNPTEGRLRRIDELAAPAVVRRAKAYIDTHLADPIGLTDIAAAARIGTRALQAAFRHHLDTTPTEYLRRSRLAGGGGGGGGGGGRAPAPRPGGAAGAGRRGGRNDRAARRAGAR
ncbi:AraC family transcriptional regulator, partial [Nocardia brasiliensis]|uniref:AraC family transcriptional regulator n=1 Tax=Nocardia brasiliensis TaxID=37326 RepID=UPI0024565B0C